MNDSFKGYIEHGWSLCSISPGTKGPTYPKWNETPVPLDAADGLRGAGILHVQSGTCSLDVDQLTVATPWLAERGVDLQTLLTARNAVRIESGRPGRAKLIYRLRHPLRTLKPAQSGLELRCATANLKSVQDVLPPSIHPTTRKPYRWAYGEELLGHWSQLPPIPATLLAAWRSLLSESPVERPASDTEVAQTKLHKWIEKQDPNAAYDEWLRVGMRLHHATGGAEEGLNLWDVWSAKATRKAKDGGPLYRDDSTCRVHWVSFDSKPGKIITTLDHELPAEADEFEIIPPQETSEQPPTDAEKAAKKVLKDKSAQALQNLEQMLVFVRASEKYFDTTRHTIISSDSSIEHQFTAMMPRAKTVTGRMNPVRVLKASTTKRFVDGLGFHPGEGALFTVNGDSFANLYRNRLPKPLEPTKLEAEKIEWIFARIEDPSYRTWLKQLYGHVAQHPAIKIKSAPLIWSEAQRNGKSTLVKTIPALLVGAEYTNDVDYALLESNFNDYLQGMWHINLLEFRAGTRNERAMITNKLKAYIADDMVALHPKGAKGYTMPNHFFVTASSNEEDAAAVDNNDKRWGVYEMKLPEYTEAERRWIYHEFLLTSRAPAVIRHYFLNISLKGFHAAGSAPMTEAKARMVASSMPPDQELLINLWEEQRGLFSRDVVITGHVQEEISKRVPNRPGAARIGKLLTRTPINGTPIQFKAGGSVYRAVIIRNPKLWVGAQGPDIMKHINNDDVDEFEVDYLA